MKYLIPVLIVFVSLVSLWGCGPGQYATNHGNGQYGIEVIANSFNPFTVTSELPKAFHAKSRSICPGGYEVLDKQLVRGRGRKSDVMIGTIKCK